MFAALLAPFRRKEKAAASRPVQLNVVRAKYDSAQTSTDNEKHWAWADGLSAASANSLEVRRRLRERSRYEVANNCYASGLVRTYANDVIGTSPQLQVNSGDDALDTLIETQFWDWWQAARIAEKLRVARMSRMVDGEVFLRFGLNIPLRHQVKLDVRVYETDQVSRPWSASYDQADADGIYYDDFGNPIAYTFLLQHPGSSFNFHLGTEYEIIPASDVIHLFRAERPGQLRGVPENLAALPLYEHLRLYTLAVLQAAETAADLSIILQTQQNPTINPDDLEPLDAFDLERGQGMVLPQGWSAMQMKAEQPTATYEMFKRQIIQEQARCIGMPYGVAAGDHSGFNYSSGKLDGMNYDRAIRIDRSGLETDFLTPLFERWWYEASLRRVVPGIERPRVDWRWEGREHQDPSKEANAQETRLANHTTTLANEYARMGLDWEDQLRQRAKELALMNELGLTMEQAAPNATVEIDDDE